MQGRRGKVSRRDVAVYLATGKTGATTVATTMMLAEMAGIVRHRRHRRRTWRETTMDISADLQEPATPRWPWSARAPRACWTSPNAGVSGDHGRAGAGHGHRGFSCSTAAAAAARPTPASTPRRDGRHPQDQMGPGLKGGVVIGNPIPEQYELDYNEMEAVINCAPDAPSGGGRSGKGHHPFLLAHIKDYTEGVSCFNRSWPTTTPASLSRIAIELVKLAETGAGPDGIL